MTDERKVCDECGTGHLEPASYSDNFLHNGTAISVDGLECHICDNCGADPVFTDQIRRKQRRIADAKRVANGKSLLPGAEILRIRETAGLAQQEAAVLLGGGPNAFSKYERGAVIQSEAMDRLLRLIDRFPFLVSELRDIQGLPMEDAVIGEGYGRGTHVCLDEDSFGSKPLTGVGVVVYMEDYRRVA
jgi:HTH-type transcriptional regulator/antitoxin MqsA